MGAGELMTNEFFIAIDANEIGKKIEKYILNEQLEELEKFSNQMLNSIYDIKEFIHTHNGKVIMAGGDNILAKISIDDVPSILDYVSNLNTNYDYKFSTGIGVGSAGAYVALKYAKVNNLFAVKYETDKFIEIK
jgi:GTP cyclohydrolase III